MNAKTTISGHEHAPGAEWWLVALCCAVYFTSYLTRKCYDASILAICDDTGLARTVAGLASMAAVALYGSGQFATGFLADKFDPRRIIFSALLITALCNATMPLAIGCVPAMVSLWAVNGFAQAMFWPPLVKIVAVNLPQERFKSAIFWISVSCNVAIVVVFLLVSGCVHFVGWKTSFAVTTALALAVAALWSCNIRRLAPCSKRADGGTPVRDGGKTGTPLRNLVFLAGLVPIMAAIACQGVLRDGIEVWAPSIVKDQYGLSTSGSIFSVVLLPVFAVGSMVAARAMRRVVGDEVKTSLVLFAIALGCAVFLFASNGSSLMPGLPVIALLSACMHGANLMLIGELPGRFARYGCVGTVSGLLNAFTYVGAAASIYGFAAIHQHFSGWRPVFALWIGVLSVGVVLLFAALRRWIPFSRRG